MARETILLCFTNPQVPRLDDDMVLIVVYIWLYYSTAGLSGISSFRGSPVILRIGGSGLLRLDKRIFYAGYVTASVSTLLQRRKGLFGGCKLVWLVQRQYRSSGVVSQIMFACSAQLAKTIITA